jgi:hypothetical protein
MLIDDNVTAKVISVGDDGDGLIVPRHLHQRHPYR